MGFIQVGSSIDSLSVTMPDSVVEGFYRDVHAGIREGKQGFFLETAPRAADEPIGRKAQGRGLVWIPFSAPIHFVFDTDAYPDAVQININTEPSMI